MTEAQKLLSEIKAAAAELGISPATISGMAGQGGAFPARLEQGKRIWPETAERVRDTIAELRARRADREASA